VKVDEDDKYIVFSYFFYRKDVEGSVEIHGAAKTKKEAYRLAKELAKEKFQSNVGDVDKNVVDSDGYTHGKIDYKSFTINGGYSETVYTIEKIDAIDE
jgi:hypothetical protein